MGWASLSRRLLARSGLGRYLPGARRACGDGVGLLKYYSDRLLFAPVDELLDDGLMPHVRAPGAIDLAGGAPRWPVPAAAAVRESADAHSYPPPAGLPELRRAVAEYLEAVHGHDRVDADGVLVTHGAAGAFAVAADALVNPGDAVVLFEPCSPLFPLMLKARRARLRWVTTSVEGGAVRFRADAFARAARRARLVVLSDPVNPTGGTFAAEELEQIVWWAKRFDALVYVDESFARLRYGGRGPHPGGVPGAAGRLLWAGGVSQCHGLMSARAGWLSAERHLARACAVSAAAGALFVPELCQRMALAALTQPDADFAPRRGELAARAAAVAERLNAVGLAAVRPAGGFYCWADVSGLGVTGRDFAERLLRHKRVLVQPGHPFGPASAGRVRVNFGGDEGRLWQGLERLAEFMHDFA